ncbi:hypothetical protein HYV43_04225 [Candidatus Micrarchaeota archaeon]|nr:hypothetical protein [Candidatus Micrarchaeota archaeon]
MRSGLLPFFLALVAATALSALSTTAEFNASLSTVDQLVRVQADFDFPPLLPGAEYAKAVSVRWALPAESLRDLKTDVVRVHVVAYAQEPTWVSFQAGGKTYRAYSFVLECRAVSGICSNGSVLEHSFQAVLRVPSNASTGHSERLFVQASLSENYPSIAVGQSGADFAAGVQDFFQSLPWDQAAQTVQRIVVPVEPTTTPVPLDASDSSNATLALSATDDVRTGSAYVPADSSTPPQQGVWHAPALLPDGRENISPVSGLVVTKDDAVFTGGVVVMILLAILFYKRFFGAQRASGLLEV